MLDLEGAMLWRLICSQTIQNFDLTGSEVTGGPPWSFWGLVLGLLRATAVLMVLRLSQSAAFMEFLLHAQGAHPSLSPLAGPKRQSSLPTVMQVSSSLISSRLCCCYSLPVCWGLTWTWGPRNPSSIKVERTWRLLGFPLWGFPSWQPLSSMSGHLSIYSPQSLPSTQWDHCRSHHFLESVPSERPRASVGLW